MFRVLGSGCRSEWRLNECLGPVTFGVQLKPGVPKGVYIGSDNRVPFKGYYGLEFRGLMLRVLGVVPLMGASAPLSRVKWAIFGTLWSLQLHGESCNTP